MRFVYIFSALLGIILIAQAIRQVRAGVFKLRGSYGHTDFSLFGYVATVYRSSSPLRFWSVTIIYLVFGCLLLIVSLVSLF